MQAHQAPVPMDLSSDEQPQAPGGPGTLPEGAGDSKNSKKSVEIPAEWKKRSWFTLNPVIHTPLHQMVGAFPHGKHHAALVDNEGDTPFWVLPNMNRQWIKDLDTKSRLVFTTMSGRNHLTLGRPTKAGDLWVLRMSISSIYLNLQFVLTDDGVPELHTSYPVLCASRTNPIPMRIFRVQQWRNLVEANIQMRLMPPIPDGMSEADALHADDMDSELPPDQAAIRAKRKDMERYLDITCYGVDYCEKQDQYHAGTVTSVFLTAIASRMVLSPNHECRFPVLAQSSAGRAYPMFGDGPDAFEGIIHVPQTYNPLMNAQVFGRIEHVEQLPGRLFGEGQEAYLLVVSVQRVPFELLVLKPQVVVGTEHDGKEAKEFIRGQRFWARCWLQCAHGVDKNKADKGWPRAVGPSSALDTAPKLTADSDSAPLPLSDGKNIANDSRADLLGILTGRQRYDFTPGDSKSSASSGASPQPQSQGPAMGL